MIVNAVSVLSQWLNWVHVFSGWLHMHDGVKNVHSFTQNEMMNAENALPVFSIKSIFGLLLPGIRLVW